MQAPKIANDLLVVKERESARSEGESVCTTAHEIARHPMDATRWGFVVSRGANVQRSTTTIANTRGTANTMGCAH